MKRFKDIALWISIIAYISLALAFMSEKGDALVCNQIEVRVVDSLKNRFVENKQILKLLNQKGINLIGKNFKEIDLKNIETIINEYPPVEKAEVYKTVNGHIAIDIDNKGFIMRTFGNFTSNVIVANGNINTNFSVTNKTNVLELEKKPGKKNKLFADLYRLGIFINNNKFWSAQIQQIYVNASGDFELIPRIGSHTIIFGDYTDCENKFNNLLSLYKNGFPVVGWNTYHTINLKFKGQIVCTKRL
jgi:cell division protein FtsQ